MACCRFDTSLCQILCVRTNRAHVTFLPNCSACQRPPTPRHVPVSHSASTAALPGHRSGLNRRGFYTQRERMVAPHSVQWLSQMLSSMSLSIRRDLIFRRYSRRLSALFTDRSTTLNPSRNAQKRRDGNDENDVVVEDTEIINRKPHSLSANRKRNSIFAVLARRPPSTPTQFHLPNELWELIFIHLASQEIWNLRRVNRDFRHASQQYLFLHRILPLLDTPVLMVPARTDRVPTCKDTILPLTHCTAIDLDLTGNVLYFEFSFEDADVMVLRGVKARFCLLWLAVAGKGYQVEFDVSWAGEAVSALELKSAQLMWYPYGNLRNTRELLLDGWRVVFIRKRRFLQISVPTCEIVALLRY